MNIFPPVRGKRVTTQSDVNKYNMKINNGLHFN